MALVNYYAIQSALADLLKTGPSGGYTDGHHPKDVFIEAMDREAVFDNMPFINVRLPEGTMEMRSIPNGYRLYLTFEIDIVCFHFTHFVNAAILRDTILGEAQLAVQQNARFYDGIDSSKIEPTIRFGAGTVEGAQGHVATATFSVIVEADIDAA